MFIQALIALAVVIGMGVTIVLLGRQPRRPRRPVPQMPQTPGGTARPDVTRYANQHTTPR